MSLKVSDFDNKILKTEKEIELLSEKINKKKKEISMFKKQDAYRNLRNVQRGMSRLYQHLKRKLVEVYQKK